MLYWLGWIATEVFEGGFDAFMLANFADKSGCRILDLLGVCQDVLENLMEENDSSFDRTKARCPGRRPVISVPYVMIRN